MIPYAIAFAQQPSVSNNGVQERETVLLYAVFVVPYPLYGEGKAK